MLSAGCFVVKNKSENVDAKNSENESGQHRREANRYQLFFFFYL